MSNSQGTSPVEDTVRNYVRGFFDRLCYVDISSRSITLTTKQMDLARRVGSMTRTLGIKCSIQNAGKAIKLRVSGRESLEKWAKAIGFEPKKMERLNRLLSSYQRVDVNATRTDARSDQAKAQGVSGEQGRQD